MGRVSAGTIKKLTAFIDSLPEEAKGKCSLCNETLVHIVKQAEAQTGAGTATVTRALADNINEDALPQDKVSSSSLRNKIVNTERDAKSICANNANKPKPKKRQPREVNNLSIKSESFDKAFGDFIKEVAQAKKDNWETTSRECVSQCINSIQFYLGE